MAPQRSVFNDSARYTEVENEVLRIQQAQRRRRVAKMCERDFGANIALVAGCWDEATDMARVQIRVSCAADGIGPVEARLAAADIQSALDTYDAADLTCAEQDNARTLQSAAETLARVDAAVQADRARRQRGWWRRLLPF